MHIPGHLAVAVAQHRIIPKFRGQRRLLATLLVASLFPDAFDKTVGYILRMMPNGRHWAHNIFSLLGLSLIVGFIWGRLVGFAWFVGYLGHLLVDSPGFVPWFFPLKRYKFYQGQLTFNPIQLVQETVLLVLTLIVCRSGS